MKNTNPLNIKIRQYLTEHPDSTAKDIQAKFHVTQSRASHLVKRFKETAEISQFPQEEAQETLSQEMEERGQRAVIKNLRQKLERLFQEHRKVSDALDAALALKSTPVPKSIFAITASGKPASEACCILMVSDCHFGKTVLRGATNGLNEYNLGIAEQRMETLAENTVKLVRKERQATTIDSCVILLLGDFIENCRLHETSMMTTSLSPLEELQFARKELSKYLGTVSGNLKFKTVQVVCVRGNHPRTTKRMSPSADFRLNYESILYSTLREDFPQFTWNIPDSGIAEFEIYDERMRAFHGMEISWQGGVGGLSVPLNKFVWRQDKVRRCAYNFFGHFHSWGFPTNSSTANGSTVGYDEYSLSLGMEYQPPVQGFQLYDREKGMTLRCPIFCQ